MRSNLTTTGIPGLDRLLDGGFLNGHLYLLRGQSGAGTTTLHSSEVDLPRTMASILSVIDSVEPDRLVLDSQTEIRVLAQERHRYRQQMMALKEYSANRNSTELIPRQFSAEVQSLAGTKKIRFLANGVLKRRTGHHERALREFVISRDGTHIGSKLRKLVRGSDFGRPISLAAEKENRFK